MTSSANASHVGSCLSCVDLIAVILAELIRDSEDKESDAMRLFLSKGHAAAALYSALEQVELISNGELEDYCKDGSIYGGHVSHYVKGVPLSTGSLGHALPFAVGKALGDKMNAKAADPDLSRKYFVIMSDGECDEGTTWESALIANHFFLNNLVVVIDRNRLQSLRSTEETIRLEPLADKWRAFGWDVFEIDGHDHDEIREMVVKQSQRPVCIIAETIKGYGIHFMENQVLWHYKALKSTELQKAIEELDSRDL